MCLYLTASSQFIESDYLCCNVGGWPYVLLLFTQHMERQRFGITNRFWKLDST
jgi:hypothetical protein